MQLDRERFRRASELFDVAVELTSKERRDYLGQHCHDEVLRRQVEVMLLADSRSGLLESDVEELACEVMADLGDDAASSALPTVPRYQVLAEIGRGGMGSVYRAERSDGHFEHQVALKLLRPGVVGAEAVERFVRERQILARLNHPNIARLLDGGVTPDGLPFFAMELVDGLPITRYADRKGLSVDNRLELFDSVCAALDYAQRRLVIHRDLKPSNVLVTGDGEVKLLDFGIAKLLDAEGEQDRQGGLTRDGARLMTPEYAAPEQLLGEPVTTATDVYSLGVLLFELLAGSRPYRLARHTPGGLERAILEDDPLKLPRSLKRESRSDVSTEPSSTNDGESPGKAHGPRALGLGRPDRLGSDLRSIVDKALQKEPDHRYPNAAALRDDLVAYRQGRPVSAHTRSLSYRAVKLLRRHRGTAVAAILVLMTLLAGVGGVVWQARVAVREAAKAVAVKELLIDLFEQSDPDALPGEEPRASDLLVRGSQRIDELDDQPAVQAELLRTMGRIDVKLGDYAGAEELLDRALEIRVELFGDDDEATAEVLDDLGQVAQALSQLERARNLHERALRIFERQSPRDARTANTLTNLASAHRRLGDYDAAEALEQKALAIDQELFGDDGLEVADDLAALAILDFERGHFEEAIERQRQVLAIKEARLPADHTDLARAHHDLALSLHRQGELAAAADHFERAIELQRRAHPQGHPFLAQSLRQLAIVFRDEDDLESSGRLLAEALEMNRRLLGEQNEEVASTLNELAIVSFLGGDLLRARDRFRASFDGFAAFLPAGHPTLLTLRGNLATIELELGRYAAAEAIYRQLLDAKRAKLGDDHPDVAFTLNSLGIVRRYQGDGIGSEQYHRQALELYRSKFGERHTEVARTLDYLGLALRDQGRHDDAEPVLRDSLEIFEGLLPPEHRDLDRLWIDLGRVLVLAGRPSEALDYLTRAEDARVERYGDEDPRTATARSALGRCLLALGRREEAAPLIVEAHALLVTAKGADYPDTRLSATDLAELHRSLPSV